jgi:hypothetical protein
MKIEEDRRCRVGSRMLSRQVSYELKCEGIWGLICGRSNSRRNAEKQIVQVPVEEGETREERVV